MNSINKFLISISVLLMGLSGYLAYQLYIKQNTPVAITKSGISPNANCNSFSYDYNNSPWAGRIDERLAKIMATNYKEDSEKSLIYINNKTNSDSDARSVWFPLESIKNYIWDIENQNCSNTNCNKEGLGLRIYFAKYPDKSSRDWLALGLSGIQNNYANRHTIFMIPTYHYGGNDIDFDPWSSSCKIPTIITDNFNPADTNNQVRARYVFFADQSATGSDGKNHGNLIPPNDPTGTSF
jgi:hypothetical protein